MMSAWPTSDGEGPAAAHAHSSRRRRIADGSVIAYGIRTGRQMRQTDGHVADETLGFSPVIGHRRCRWTPMANPWFGRGSGACVHDGRASVVRVHACQHDVGAMGAGARFLAMLRCIFAPPARGIP